MPIGIKFSQFIAGGNLKVTDKTVGVRNDLNTIFTDPSDGILDENGNYLLRYASGSPNAVNAILFKNAATGNPAEITVGGSDSDASLKIYPKENGSLIFETPSEGDITLVNIGNGSINLISSGLGDINLATNMGKVIINETTGINAILDEDDMISNSATAVPTQQSVKAYVDNTFALVDPTFVTNTDERYRLPNSQPLSILSTGFATVTTTTGIMGTRIHTGTSNQITVTNGSGASGNPTYSLPSTLIAPGTFQATTSINIGGAGATVTSISTDGTLAGNSDTLTVTQKAVKTYVDTAETATKSYSYITKTDNTANLPNSTPLSGLATGFLANTTATGVLTPRTMTGTTNEINVANGDGSGVPTFSLSSTLIAPGTFQATTSINIGGAGATVTSISTDGTMAANSDALLSTQKAIKTYVDTTGGAAVTLTNAGIAGGTTSLINDGTGPALAVKGLVGSTNISVTTNTTDTTIALTGTIAVTNALTMNNSGIGDASGATFNGAAAKTISYNTIGASPLAGSSSLVTVGTISSGTWQGTAINVAYGGTGVSSIGASGTLAQSDGSKYTFTTATYPTTAGTSGTVLQSNGTNIVNSTARYPGTASTSGTFLQADGTNWGASAMTVPTSAGTAGKIWRSDGTNVVLSTPTFPNTATSGKLMRADGTNWVETTAQYPTTAGATGNVLTSDGTNFVSSAPPASTLTFNTVTGSTQAMAVSNSYYSTYAGTCVMTLPSTAVSGSEIEVITDASHVIQIAQNSGQLIYFGALNGVSQVTTTGVGGSLTTVDPNTVIRIKCIVTNTTWAVIFATNPVSGV